MKELRTWYDLKLDVCAEDFSQSCCKKFLTARQTYKRPWDENFFMNPPWKTDIMEQMLKRAIEQCLEHHVVGVCLLPSYTGADFFHELVDGASAQVTHIWGRVKYWRDGEPWRGSPNIDSIIAIYHYAEVK